MTSPPPLPGLETVQAEVTVLCVDGDQGCLDFVQATLERENRFDVLTASSPTGVLEALDGVDCVVSDYEMPEMDGVELLGGAGNASPDSPFSS